MTKTMARSRSAMRAPPFKKRILYILVMGLMGAGKSTFISVVTGNGDIPIGGSSDMEGVTVEVQDYILEYVHKNILYEIHLIDSPGFDDGNLGDSQVLSNIVTYLNMNYKLKKRLAGVLYLHDITKAKMGNVGEQNVRMLENMIGSENYSNCTIVTTKWGCTTDPKGEEDREKTLKMTEKFFGGMLDNPSHAEWKRFHPKTKETALEIIIPYLDSKFTPQISHEMVNPEGPKLTLGETKAGEVILGDLEKLAKTKQKLVRVNLAQEILSQKYDEKLFGEFNRKRKRLRRKIRAQKSGRWILRITIVSGAIVATVFTSGPGASTFALLPVFEKAVASQRKKENKEVKALKAAFVKESQQGQLKNTNPDWMWDKNVESIEDLKRYTRGSEIARFATSSKSAENLLNPNDSEIMYENSGSDDSDSELSDFDEKY